MEELSKVCQDIIKTVKETGRLDHIPFCYKDEASKAVEELRKGGYKIYTSSNTYPNEYGILIEIKKWHE